MGKTVNQRTESKLDTIVKALDLADYTIEITSNPTKFPEQYWKPITSDIVETAKNIYLDCWSANNIRVDDRKTYEYRFALQLRAKNNCTRLLALMRLAHKRMKFETKKLKYWGDKTTECRKLIQGWIEPDRKRYDKP